MQQRIQRFGRILKLRENYRQTEQMVLAEERREEDSVIQKLDSLAVEKSMAVDVFRDDSLEKTVSLQEIWLQRQTIDVIEKRIDSGKESLNNVRRRIVDTEQRLMERHRDVRLMETYVDRLKTDAEKELIDIEQGELDDVAVTRYGRVLVEAGRKMTQPVNIGARKGGV